MTFINANQAHYIQHINMAKIAWIEFKRAITHEASNFKEYRQEILADVKRVASVGIDEPWLTVEINQFIRQLSE